MCLLTIRMLILNGRLVGPQKGTSTKAFSRNDILRKHGVIPEKPPSPTPMIQEAILEARKQAHENRLEDKDLDGLHELEDEEDDAFLERYRYGQALPERLSGLTRLCRKQRMVELSTITTASIYNQVFPLQKPDYSRDVTEASKKTFVFVHLTSSLGTNIESRILTELWREMARKFGDMKFCEIRADMCIEGYPEKNTPTILVYRDGDIKKQIVTLRELGGDKTGVKGQSTSAPAAHNRGAHFVITDLEQLLVSVEAVEANDHRLSRSEKSDGLQEEDGIRSSARHADDDDDWD